MVQQQNTTPCVSNFITEVRAKEPERDAIRLKCEQFFAGGGKIKEIPIGESGEVSKEQQKVLATQIKEKLGLGASQDAAKNGGKKVSSGADLVGMQFNDYTVIGPANKNPKKSERVWVCVCKCGTTDNIRTSYLVGGIKKRCSSCTAVRKSKAQKSQYQARHGQ